MIHDFDKVIDRRNSDSSKWNVKDNEIAMSIADMDFQVAKPIREAIHKKADYGIFGYTDVPERYYQVIADWWKNEHNFTMKQEWMVFSTGVVPAISSIVRKLTTPAENVLIQSPVYNIFYNSIYNNGRNILSSDLVYKDRTYEIDFNDLEEKLANPQTTMMILCNPHNPVGKIWDKHTLMKIGELCNKHHVIVVSDEIHCDITLTDESYIPFASVNETCANISITCVSASKAFNMAGLQAACVIIPNRYLRHKVIRGLNTDEVAEPNVFAIDATIAAFQSSRDWLIECVNYIRENRKIASQYLRENIKELTLINAKATYLLWIDCQKITNDTRELCDYLRNETGLIVSDGAGYGKNGKGFIRVNIACPRTIMMEGLKRLEIGINKFKENN